MAVSQPPLPGKIVKKSNALARAQWQPQSIWEPRIVALVASKVQESDDDFLTYRIPVSELTGVSDENLRGNQYRDIERSIANLGKATIRIEGNKPRNFRQYSIFSMCGYEDGYLIAEFHPDLKPHFLNLKAQFTAYNLYDYLKLPSIYSQRIFEILKSWSNMPEFVISILELHKILETPESFRKDFRNFRIRVLEKAYKDIHKKTSLRFEWEPVKTGRSVGAIRFLFASGQKAIANEKENEKEHVASNKAFLEAVKCAKEKNGECTKCDNKKFVCEICHRIGSYKEIHRRPAE